MMQPALMASASVQIPDKTASLWKRAEVLWIFGHDRNKCRTIIVPCVNPGPPMLTTI